ncbi:MAG: DUF4124 domain-containing protein [Gammaproteobacteria bacterium]|nr:DUF4124 domain-containing protein [Gammaproteobacteria bacterium]MBI5618978.1 DUF4124 domain-containing protein [Gammaproteobacteria bacterium]
MFALALGASVHAAEGDVYRSKDASGATVFSDAPSPGAEKIELRQTPTFPGTPPAEPSQPRGAPTDAGPAYDLVAISSPADEETLHSAEGPVQVSVTVQPQLRVQAGHRVGLNFDGQPVGAPKPDTVFVIKDVERGEHTLQAFVVGRDGKTLGQSASVTFYMYQHSKLFPPPKINPQPQANPKK